MNLKEFRKSKHVSQQEIADKLHTKQSNISRIEAGKVNPSLDFAIRYLDVLGYKLEVVKND